MNEDWVSIGRPRNDNCEAGRWMSGGTAYAASASTFADHQDTGASATTDVEDVRDSPAATAETGSSGVSERSCFKTQGEEHSRKTLRLPSSLHVGTNMWVYTCERVSTPPPLYIRKKKKKRTEPQCWSRVTVSSWATAAQTQRGDARLSQALVGSRDGDRQRKHKVTVRRGVSSGFSLHR